MCCFFILNLLGGVVGGAMKSSFERKHMAFKLIQSLLPTLRAEEVGVVFSSTVLEHLMLQGKHEGKPLYSTIQDLVCVCMYCSVHFIVR